MRVPSQLFSLALGHAGAAPPPPSAFVLASFELLPSKDDDSERTPIAPSPVVPLWHKTPRRDRLDPAVF